MIEGVAFIALGILIGIIVMALFFAGKDDRDE